MAAEGGGEEDAAAAAAVAGGSPATAMDSRPGRAPNRRAAPRQGATAGCSRRGRVDRGGAAPAPVRRGRPAPAATNAMAGRGEGGQGGGGGWKGGPRVRGREQGCQQVGRRRGSGANGRLPTRLPQEGQTKETAGGSRSGSDSGALTRPNAFKATRPAGRVVTGGGGNLPAHLPTRPARGGGWAYPTPTPPPRPQPPRLPERGPLQPRRRWRIIRQISYKAPTAVGRCTGLMDNIDMYLY